LILQALNKEILIYNFIQIILTKRSPSSQEGLGVVSSYHPDPHERRKLILQALKTKNLNSLPKENHGAAREA